MAKSDVATAQIRNNEWEIQKVNSTKLTKMKPRIEVGQRFGSLVVLEYLGTTDHGKRVWNCKCDCGRTKRIVGSSLTNGKTKTCGGYAHRSTTLPFGEAAFNGLLRVYKSGAKTRNYKFDLTKDEFRTLTKGDCYYCGKAPSSIFPGGTKPTRMYGTYTYNGIDRKNNNEGYTVENCVSCCGTCNRIKMNFSYDQFLDHVYKIFLNRIKND